MRIISRARTCEKTVETIMFASHHRLHIVCVSQEEAQHINLMAKNMNIDIPEAVAWFDVYTKLPGTPKVLVESADWLLNQVLEADVVAITVTGDVEVA